MNGPSTPQRNPQSAAARFDRTFIEDHDLLERYLSGKLPFKGARDLEHWCREHPEYLQELNLAERTHAGLRLLEASGRPQDLGEPRPPWWKTPYFSIGAGVVAFFSLVGFWALFGKYVFLNDRLADARAQLSRGSMVPATAASERRISPERAPGTERAQFTLDHKDPEFVNLRIDMSYSRQERFRVEVDKQDQGRALVINDLAKDSNGDLKVSFNTSALAGGKYAISIEALPFRGAPIAEGWLTMNVR
ncbi:MAG TPA: hypothetical protein VMV25_06125 [Steroidobacteraceae bacterium]|nr:hypothetical protein [Steroidobacteraceae bacterium]